MNRRHLLKISPALFLPNLAQAMPNRTQQFIEAARSQVGKTLTYDPNYTRIAYPNGDVPMERGVCTDVIIRAYRQAFGIDLQRLIHEDMTQNFAAYPKKWGLNHADSNIDHRRVANLRTFFIRHGGELKFNSEYPRDVIPGDIVTVKLPGNLDHIGIVSDKMSSATNAPDLIHNIGQGTREEDVLLQFLHTGHYRFLL